MRDEKEERKKQARSNKQTRQSNTAHPNVHVSMYSCALVHSTVEHFVVADVHVHVRRKITYRNVFNQMLLVDLLETWTIYSTAQIQGIKRLRFERCERAD